jgi:hypothetical protein
MTEDRFDALTKQITTAASRRGLLKGALALALGGVATRVSGTGRAEARARIKMACAREGQYCDPAQAALGRVVCCPGLVCNENTELCAPEGRTCAPGMPAESCGPGGVPSSCGPEGFCGQVTDVDGGCACIERTCGEPPQSCTTGADCQSGLCVDVPGCCGEPGFLFCATPCAAGLTATGFASTRGAWGWGH